MSRPIPDRARPGRAVHRRWALALTLLCAALSHANFDEAMDHYQRGEFEQAFVMLQRMAEIGYPPARFNLGVMYYNGEYVDKDVLTGYAWIRLAGLDLDEARVQADAIWKSLNERGRALGDEIAREINRRYGPAALAKRLLPQPLADADCPPERRLIEQPPPRYPRNSRITGHMGTVLLIYDISREGRVTYPAVLSGHAEFFDTSLEAVSKFRYAPGPAITGSMIRITYQLPPWKASRQLMEKLREDADNGSPLQKYTYATHIAFFDEQRPEQRVINGYLVDAARAGFPEAQFMLGRRILFGRGCVADPVKGLAWLQLSAEGTYSPAQYLIAERLDKWAHERERAVIMLENAADSGYVPAMLKLAWILATDSKRLDPPRALQLVTAVDGDYPDRITRLDTLAAAHAANGDFGRASKLENRAMRIAKRQKWNLPELAERLELYARAEPWRAPEATSADGGY